MRIAVSGTHVIGKSTLVEELSERLVNHIGVPEPYKLLEDLGYTFAYPPSTEDYVAQLKASLAVLRRSELNLIVERTPLDFLGYICASIGGEQIAIDPWMTPISRAVASLDLVVLLQVNPQDNPGENVEDTGFRLAVDHWLREIVGGDRFDLCDDVDMLVLACPWHQRLDRVMAYIKER